MKLQSAAAANCRKHDCALIEPLEPRIAPATLVNPTTVTFLNGDGGQATVTISKPLFTHADVNHIFFFDTGSVSGSNSVAQELQLLDIAALGPAASGLSVSITAVPGQSSPAMVNVGFIDASGIALGNVTVNGDLGRIDAGDFARGVHSLIVDSMGAQGLATQRHSGATLDSRIAGPAGSVTVDGNIDGASIEIDGGMAGTLSRLTVTGEIVGGSNSYSGSIRTEGGIAEILVGGGIVGGGGAHSGMIGASGKIGEISVAGSVGGGAGNFSGAIFAAGDLGSVEIDGSVSGGGGAHSGEVSTESNLGFVNVLGSVEGGSGLRSGSIQARGNIAAITIGDGLFGSDTASAGHIGAGANIGGISLGLGGIGGDNTVCNVSAGGSIGSFASSGPVSGTLVEVRGSIGSISFNEGQPVSYAFPGDACEVAGFDAGGSIGSINSYGNIDASVFVAGNYLGSNFLVEGNGVLSNSVNPGFRSAEALRPAHIGNITVTGPAGAGSIMGSTFLAGVDGKGRDKMLGTSDDLVPAGSSIGNISVAGNIYFDWFESGGIGATNSGFIIQSDYIATDGAVSSEGIGPIAVNAMIASNSWIYSGIDTSNFTSRAGIGDINVTLGGIASEGNDGISVSTFAAGRTLGNITVVNNGTVPTGDSFGTGGIVLSGFFAGRSGDGGIGNIDVAVTDPSANGPHAGINAIFDASSGPHSTGNIGDISVNVASSGENTGGIGDSIFRAHGSIGTIISNLDNAPPAAAAIGSTTFSAYGSIGNITVSGSVLGGGNGPSLFLAGYDIGSDPQSDGNLIADAKILQGGQSVGNVNVTGYFEGSDIIASVNPDASDNFGWFTPNTNVGPGGSIGFVNIGTDISMASSPFVADQSEHYAIEAAHFAASGNSAPTVTAFGYTSTLPAVLYVDGINDVRIVQLTGS